MTTAICVESTSLSATGAQEPFPYDSSPMRFLLFVPIIGLIFVDIINSSLNDLLYTNPPPSLQRRIKIYNTQDENFFAIFMHLFYGGWILLQTMMRPVSFHIYFASLITVCDGTYVIVKNMLQRRSALNHFGDSLFVHKTWINTREQKTYIDHK